MIFYLRLDVNLNHEKTCALLPGPDIGVHRTRHSPPFCLDPDAAHAEVEGVDADVTNGFDREVGGTSVVCFANCSKYNSKEEYQKINIVR